MMDGTGYDMFMHVKSSKNSRKGSRVSNQTVFKANFWYMSVTMQEFTRRIFIVLAVYSKQVKPSAAANLVTMSESLFVQKG